MASIFRFVDTDLTTVRLDLNAGVGTNGLTYFELDWGALEPDDTWLYQTPFPGAVLAASRDPLVQGSFRLYAKHSSEDNLITLARSLDTELQRESILEWRPDGASASVFADVLSFVRPALFRGDNLTDVIRGLHDPKGLPMVFYKHPGFRKASASLTLSPDATVTNEVGNRHVTYAHAGNLPSPVKIEATIAAAGAETAMMRVFRKVFSASADRDEFDGYYDTAATSLSATYGSNTATSGSVARTTFAATGYFLPRLKWVITPTRKTALTGSYRVMAVLNQSVGTKSTIKMLWGNRNNDPLDHQADPVTVDFTNDVSSAVNFEQELGTVSFDEDGDALVMEFHAQRDVANGGTDTLDWVSFYLAPVGDSVMAHSYGLMNEGRILDTWTGDELSTAPTNPASLVDGTVDEKTVILNADNDAAATKPNTGTALTVAWHIYELECTLYEPGGGTATQHGEFRIRNITDSTTVATKVLKTKGGREWTSLTKTIRFLSVSGKSYQPQIEFTDASPTSGAKLVVKRLTHSVIPIVNSSAKFVLDGIDEEAEIQTSGGVRTSGLKLREGSWPSVPPGYVIDIFSFGDVAPLGYDDASDSPLVKVELTRSATLAYTHQERVSH